MSDHIKKNVRERGRSRGRPTGGGVRRGSGELIKGKGLRKDTDNVPEPLPAPRRNHEMELQKMSSEIWKMAKMFLKYPV